MFARWIMMTACVASCGRIGFDPLVGDAVVGDALAGTTGIAWTGAIMQAIAPGPSAGVTVSAPSCATGDIFLAVIAVGTTGAPTMTSFTAPPDWNLIRRADHANDTAILIYWHAVTATEPAGYSWGFDNAIQGVAWISCYTGVDSVSPIEADMALVDSSGGPVYASPSIVTTSANAMLVATFAAHDTATPTTWMQPPGTNLRITLNNGGTRSGMSADLSLTSAGATPNLSATASVPQDYALVHVLALKPAPSR